VSTRTKLTQASMILSLLTEMTCWSLTKKANKKAQRNLARAVKAAAGDVRTYSQRLMDEQAAEDLDHLPALQENPAEERTL
jgi:hypothetical protein